MTRILRFGVIGAGSFTARRHLPAIAADTNVALVALCRRDKEALAALAHHFPCEQTYTDWRQMLGECPLDAVLISTPHSLHYEQAREALDRGIHVLLEKPMTLLRAEAAELCATAQSAGLVLAVALNPPHWAHCHRIREAVLAGSLGDVEAVDILFSCDAESVFGRAPFPSNQNVLVQPTLFRADVSLNGGGYFIDAGTHLVSEALWVTGLNATRVCCLMDRTPDDRRAILAMELENGAQVSINTLGDSRLDRRCIDNTFVGSKGTAHVESPDFNTTIRLANGDVRSFCEKDGPPVSSPVSNFVDAIVSGAQLYSPGTHGEQVVAVIEAAYRSADSRAWIDI